MRNAYHDKARDQGNTRIRGLCCAFGGSGGDYFKAEVVANTGLIELLCSLNERVAEERHQPPAALYQGMKK
ncbi:hypothetical protein [Anoxynatronum sibiricum]|uniref:Uncharacterized protein n=1 Tax=Anoxynatronum sibiricum TaxID=210623 RepID=A0ABU9VSA1_9CLOT